MSNLVTAKSATVRQEGTHVILIQDGRAVLALPWDGALELARAIYSQAKRAEELANADAIATDQAILLRLGVPLGLSKRRDIQQEAQRRAAWDSGLRRYINGKRARGTNNMKATPVVGTPTIENKRG